MVVSMATDCAGRPASQQNSGLVSYGIDYKGKCVSSFFPLSFSLPPIPFAPPPPFSLSPLSVFFFSVSSEQRQCSAALTLRLAMITVCV